MENPKLVLEKDKHLSVKAQLILVALRGEAHERPSSFAEALRDLRTS